MSRLEHQDSGILCAKQDSYRSDECGAAKDQKKQRIGISVTIYFNDYDTDPEDLLSWMGGFISSEINYMSCS